MTQEEWVLRQLKKQSLTPLQAFVRFGILRLAAVVYDLKKKGHRIATKMEEKGNKRFAKYSLKG
jgi:hypothetical protein